MDKSQNLLKLKQGLESRRDIPLIQSANDVVFGDGSPDAEVMFIGEAAGYWETVEHKPFVGPAGKLLTRTLNENGMKREDVYISNIIKARPPNNRDPLPQEIEAFAYYLDKEIEIIQPKIICTLGRYSMAKFMPEVSISKVHGQARFFDFSTVNRELTNYKPIIFPMYHPAAALRAGSVLAQFQEDFRKLRNLLGGKTDEVATIETKAPEPQQQGLF